MTIAVEIDRPIFIVGVGRSGTSLLQSMLNAHSQICFPPESQFIRSLIASRRLQRALRRGHTGQVLEKVSNHQGLKKVDVDPERICEELIEEGHLSLENLYRRILIDQAERNGKSRVGDKDPKNLEYLPEIYSIFPDAQIIHLVRDPRDVVLSRTRASWSKHRFFVTQAFTYEAQITKARRDGPRLFGERFIELHYEDLISDPGNTLKKLCGKLGVGYEESMLTYYKDAGAVVQGKEIDWKKNVFKPVLSENKEKWREGLSNSQVHLVELICTTAFSHLGYARSDAQRPRSTVVALSDWVGRVAANFAKRIYLAYHWLRFRRSHG